MRDAHSDQNVAASGAPPDRLDSPVAGNVADAPPLSESADERPARDDETATELVVDDSGDAAAAAAVARSPSPAAEVTASSAGLNDASEI